VLWLGAGCRQVRRGRRRAHPRRSSQMQTAARRRTSRRVGRGSVDRFGPSEPASWCSRTGHRGGQASGGRPTGSRPARLRWSTRAHRTRPAACTLSGWASTGRSDRAGAAGRVRERRRTAERELDREPRVRDRPDRGGPPVDQEHPERHPVGRKPSGMVKRWAHPDEPAVTRLPGHHRPLLHEVRDRHFGERRHARPTGRMLQPERTRVVQRPAMRIPDIAASR
jgi:hypothetical protein